MAFRVLDPLLGWPLMRLANRRARGVVVLYHRVSSDEGPDYPPLDPGVFREHLDVLSALFDVLPLSELVERLAAGRALQGCCALTFDDGYADFLTDALPAITERGLPVTHFLVVDSLLTGRIPWNARLARILRLDGSCVKEDPTIALERLSQMPWRERDALLEDWEGCIDGVGAPPPAMIRSADIGHLLAGGVEIGAHTHSHCFLTHMTSEEANIELTESRRHLEDMCDGAILFASYPQGLHSPSVESLARRAGYRAAFGVGSEARSAGDQAARDSSLRCDGSARLDVAIGAQWVRSFLAPIEEPVSRLRVVLLTSGSPWQRALANRLATEESLRLVGIVIQSMPRSMRWDWATKAFLRHPGLLGKKIIMRLVLGRVIKEIAAAELEWFGESGRARAWPDVPLLRVQDINANEVVTFLENQRPDIGAVSGTRIITSCIRLRSRWAPSPSHERRFFACGSWKPDTLKG